MRWTLEVNTYHARLYADKNREELLTELTEFYTEIIKNCNTEFTFTHNAIAEIEKLHIELISVAKNHSEKGRNYTDRVAFPLQDILVKMACIQALSCFRTEVNEYDVQLAYIDLFEFYASTLDFVNQKVLGLLDYGETWRGATSEDAKCLEFLFNSGAITKEDSTISIREYIEFIAKLRGISERSAERHYYRHIKNGWIESVRIGQHDSVVWLTFTPKTNAIINPKAINLEETEYHRIWTDLDRISDEQKSVVCGVADSQSCEDEKTGECLVTPSVGGTQTLEYAPESAVSKTGERAFDRCFNSTNIDEEVFDDFEDYTDVQPLDEPIEDFCEQCEDYCLVSFKAEKDGHTVLLCDHDGRTLDRYLYGNGGRFE